MSPLSADARHTLRLGSRLVRPVGDGPELLCVFVSSRCDANCAHCFDFARRGADVRARDLSTQELDQLARHTPPLYYLLLTGGETYLRPDLDRVALSFARHARPRVIATPTNGGRPDAILATVRRILDGLPAGVTLSVNVSIDGVGELHDRIRGTPGLYTRATETVRRLSALAQHEDALMVGVITVVSAHNQDHLDAIMDTVLDDLRVPSWAPFLIRGEPRDPASTDVDIDRYAAVSRRLERRVLERRYRESSGLVGARLANAKNVVRRNLIEQIAREGRRPVPCLAGSHAAVIWADGQVGACELRDPTMGDLRDFDMDLGRLWRSPSAQATREDVRGSDCACTHENVLSTSIAFDWRQWPQLARWAWAFSRAEAAPSPHEPPAPTRAAPADDAIELSCFVPTWNEAAIIAQTTRALDEALSQSAHGHEIIVVDDGSTDGTAEVIQAMRHPRVRVIRGGPGPSYRGQIARHLLDGRGRYICFMDADLNANAHELAHLLETLRQGGDVAIASRYLDGSDTHRGMTRLGLSIAYNTALRYLFDSPLRDHQCGLKAFRRPAIAHVLDQMGSEAGANRGWFWDAEVLIRAQHLGYDVTELPTTWSDDLRQSRARIWRQYRMLPWLLRLHREVH